MATQIDLGAVVPIGKGDWDIDTTYERTNIVRHNSAAWVCKVNTSIGVEPSEDSSDWYLLTKDTSSVTSVNGQKGDVTINIETVETPEENDVSNKIVNTEWVNNKITPIKSKLSSTTNTADTAKNTATLANSTANTALKNANKALSDLNNYLPITGGIITDGAVTYKSSSLDDSKVPSNIIEYNPIGITDKNGWYAAGISAYNETDGNKTLQLRRIENNGSDSCFINLSINNGFKSIYTNAQALTLGGNPPDSANGTEAITAAWANKNIDNKINEVNSNLANYLPRNGTYTLDIPGGEFGVGVGTTWDNSPSLTLYGADRDYDGTSGWFALRARLSPSNGYDLIGKPSGELAWGGAHIVRHINGVYADVSGGVDVINKVKVNNAGHADSAGYADSAGSASSSYMCTGVVVWNSTTSAILPNYGTWAWLCAGVTSESRAGSSAGGTQIYYDSSNESRVSIIAIRVG